MLQRPLEPTELTPQQQAAYDAQYQLQLINERDQLVNEIEAELLESGNYPYVQSICGFGKVSFDPDNYNNVGDEAMAFIKFCYETPNLPGIATAFMEFSEEYITEPNDNWRHDPCWR